MSSPRSHVTVIKASRLIDGTGRPSISDAEVLVRNGIIEAVGGPGEVAIPSEAEIIDFEGETLLPGLIDAHVHLSIRPDVRMLEGQLEGMTHPDAKQMLRTVRNARVQLLSGVTSAYIVGEVHFNDVIFSEAVTSGLIPGPRILPCGNFVTTTAGHGPAEYRSTDGPHEMMKFVRRNIEHGAHHIKLTITSIERAGPNSGCCYAPGEANFTVEEVMAAVKEAHRHRRRVTAHASGDSIEVALKGGVDSIQHGYDLTDEIIRMLLERSTPVVNTYAIKFQGYFRPEDWRFLDTEAGSSKEWIDHCRKVISQARRQDPNRETEVQKRKLELRRAFESGVPLSAGTDSMQGLMALELETLVDAGLTPLHAICAATGVAAKTIGWEENIGTIQKGKFADLISVKGNPEKSIADVANVHLIMIGGRRLDGLSFN